MQAPIKDHWHVILNIFTFVTTIGLTITMMLFGARIVEAEALPDIDGSTVTQVSVDWTTQPFVSLQVSDIPCEDIE